MAAIPFMPFYVADYLSDARHLSTIEHGAYLLLIMTYWQRGKPLPDDDKKLARIAGLTPRQWSNYKDTISEFFDVAGKQWRHSRIDAELQNVHAKSLKKRKAGLARAKQMHSTSSANAKRSDTDTDIPLSKDKGAKPDSDKEFWSDAKAYLKPHTKSDPGGLVGKWVKQNDQETVAKAITAAQIERAVDPISFITACLKNAKSPKMEFGPC